MFTCSTDPLEASCWQFASKGSVEHVNIGPEQQRDACCACTEPKHGSLITKRDLHSTSCPKHARQHNENPYHRLQRQDCVRCHQQWPLCLDLCPCVITWPRVALGTEHCSQRQTCDYTSSLEGTMLKKAFAAFCTTPA